jgi:hypothetical protein
MQKFSEMAYFAALKAEPKNIYVKNIISSVFGK